MTICELNTDTNLPMLNEAWQNIGDIIVEKGNLFEIVTCDYYHKVLWSEEKDAYFYVEYEIFEEFFTCVDNEENCTAKWSM